MQVLNLFDTLLNISFVFPFFSVPPLNIIYLMAKCDF